MSSALARLESCGLIRMDGVRYRTTRRWQGAMARAALRLLAEGEHSSDLRVPITHALVELFGSHLDDDELASLVEAVTPIEAAELGAAAPSGAHLPMALR